MKMKTEMMRWIWAVVLLLWYTTGVAGVAGVPGITRVDPGMDHASVTQLLNAAMPGDTILFGAGTYPGNYILENLHGEVNRPVVIRGEGKESTLIDGETDPGMGLNHNAFRLKNCSWVTIGDFSIRNCWTDLVKAENSSWISLHNCSLYGGKRALYATGRDSHHFLVEQCTWEQDPRVWTHEGDFSWDEIHHGVHRHYNGSIFQGSGISGVFVLRDNEIRNTFNAFRLSTMEDVGDDLLACTNGEIFRNTIYNTSDNVLEPEVHVLNLHFYHNTMVNGHAFISVTEVKGGALYIYGNTAMSLPDSDDGWTVFKISSGRDSLTLPSYIFNNSWQVDFDMIGSPRNRWQNNHLRHFNNACFSEASDTFGIYGLGIDNHFDYDCSNVPFPCLLTSAGHEKNGIVADPLFRDPLALDFRLKEGSPCIDAGKRDELILTFGGKRPDIGAWEGEQRVEGRPFRYMEPEMEVPYKELPRITRMKLVNDKVQIWFSLPMDAASLQGTSFSIGEGNILLAIDYKSLSKDGYLLTLSSKQLSKLSTSGPGGLKLYISHWPLATNGQTLTSWASEIKVSLK